MIKPARCRGLGLFYDIVEIQVTLTIIAEYPLISNTRLALIPHIGDPDRSDADALLLRPLIQIVPEGLV